MGQFMSISDNHNDLIDSLIHHNFIRTVNVEKVLRCVDRKMYFPDQDKEQSYRDAAWQSSEIHLSAPSVYASALECLELQQGNTFLNIGSGIGYFSTVAGLLLGMNGVNHGIEINPLFIDRANQKLEEFKTSAAAIDYYNFCEPVFIQGNACELSPIGFYDRVYCGASVPPEESNFMKSLIKVGGILVMPLDGYLVKVTRKSEHTYQIFEALEVTFSNLIVPEKCSFNTVQFPSDAPLSLLEMSRFKIRSLLRENLLQSFPDLVGRTKCILKSYSETSQPSIRQDQLVQLIRIQYGISEEGLMGLQNLFDTFSRLDEAISDVSDADSLTDNELDESLNHEEELDDSNDSDDSCSELRTSYTSPDLQGPVSDEITKRKSPEAGCSEPNRTTDETENSKRMKMNLSPSKSSIDEASTSTQSDGSDAWETYSNSSRSSLLSEACLLPTDENFDNLFKGYESAHCSSDAGSDEPSVLNDYKFTIDYKENKLSKLLKEKIDSLPIPVPLKNFLNYYRID